jgi:hypothetical protein
MNFVLYVFFCSLLCLPIFAQQKTDKELNDIHGPVHIVHTMTYFTVKTEKTIKKGIQSESTETYNRQGDLIESRSGFGMSASKSTFHRDANGNRIEKLTILPPSPNPKMPPPPLSPAGTGADVLEFKTTYQFEPEKKRLTATTHRASGELLQMDVYVFDDRGRLAEHARQDGPDAPFGSRFWWQYQRNAKGVVTETVDYDKDGAIKGRTRFQSQLDAHGNWIKRTETPTDATGKASDTQFSSVRTITYY